MKTITISSILGGFSVSDYFASDGQYLPSVGIDPDLPVSDSDIMPCGLIRPTAYASFNGAS